MPTISTNKLTIRWGLLLSMLISIVNSYGRTRPIIPRFPSTTDISQAAAPFDKLFATKLNPDGNQVLWSTILDSYAAYSGEALAEPTATVAVAVKWADLTVRVMTKAPLNTPTYGSRALGYLGLTMYETVVWSSRKYRSVAPGLCDTLRLPQPAANQIYCWELALNAGQAYLLHQFYGYTKDYTEINNTAYIDSLASAIHEQYAAKNPADIVERSEQFGKAIAERIYLWSKSDGGDESYKRNFPKDYKRPQGQGLWVPPTIGQSNTKFPMHPTWGQNRTFLKANNDLPLPKPLDYSTDSTSAYYKEYKQVHDRRDKLTEEERAIVMWWGDDPTQTCSPPGHSYNIATIAIRKTSPDLVKAAQTYCRVGMAIADAFTICWKVKFTYNVERPSSFIKATLQTPDEVAKSPWLPFFLEPPFPTFYSGHATQSAATATVLTELYGDKLSFTDETHADRPSRHYIYGKKEYDMTFRPRYYKSFWDAARECAESRLMGGIHTRYDNEVGLAEGTKIGRHINALHWK